jgi:Predicted aminopeptidases
MLRQVKKDMTELCVNIRGRHVGSEGNQQATQYAARRFLSSGFSVSGPDFNCITWEHSNIVLMVGDEEINAYISPYSLSCKISSSFVTAGSMEELSGKDFSGRIAVLYGELTKEQIAPKNFVFYNPDEHKRIIRLLEEKKPAAIVAITGRNPEMAGAMYPFPLFEDGDFDIPSAYLTEEEGEKILENPDKVMYLMMKSMRIPSKGTNVVAVKRGKDLRRIMLCAHIDAKYGSPGALDNSTGVAALMSLADTLRDYNGKFGIELLIINGEDYYAASGEMLYLEQNRDNLDKILVAVNTDGAGFKKGRSSYCCFECCSRLEDAVKYAFSDEEEFTAVEPWYQSDHMVFVMNGVPAVAITSEKFMEITSDITHTPKDTIDNVDYKKICRIVDGMRNMIFRLNDTL